MGAKQRGQTRGKKPQGSMKGSPMSQRKLNQTILVPSLEPSRRGKSLQNWAKDSEVSASHAISMSEEARNTDRDRRTAAWGATNFRHNGISFVSAGPLQREEDAWNTVSEDDSPQKQSEAEQIPQAVQTVQDPPQHEQREQHEQEYLQPSIEDADPPLETNKNELEAIIPEEQTAPVAQPVSVVPTVNGHTNMPSEETFSDSDEEIVFVGRQTGHVPIKESAATLSNATQSVIVPVPVPAKTVEKAPTPIAAIATKFSSTIAIGLDSPADHATPSKSAKSRRNLRRFDEEEALMQDYIDNMALDDESEEAEEEEEQFTRRKPFKKTEHIRMFGSDGLENAKVQMRSRNSAKAQPVQAIDWDSDDLADFDDLSTTDEEIEHIGQVIRHRERESGPQYLVVASDGDASDAKWMLHSKLKSESALAEIQIFHEIRMMDVDEDTYDDEEEDEEDESEEEALQDLIDDIESEDDENARIMQRTARMTDEEIARALALQEELGLGSDEIILFDGNTAASGPEAADSDAFGEEADFIPFDLKRHTSNRGRTKRNKKQRDSFPPAEAFADALDQGGYGAFDIMDFERPSLRQKRKGRKADFFDDLDGLDEDLRDNLVNTWTKDREKKASRKREKEEARFQAMLEAGDGSDPIAIKASIRSFLVRQTEVLTLPPMEASMRAAVHRVAKTFKLTSRSEGKDGLGIGRYPVLTKTPRTPAYSHDTIWEVDNLLNQRKYFPKGLYKTARTSRSAGATRTPRRGGGGGVMSGATYRDGEEVAASAPEIGSDNRGRAMLEKMGWSPGVGIGAVGNKGSLDPIKHIVKTTKAGLG